MKIYLNLVKLDLVLAADFLPRWSPMGCPQAEIPVQPTVLDAIDIAGKAALIKLNVGGLSEANLKISGFSPLVIGRSRLPVYFFVAMIL